MMSNRFPFIVIFSFVNSQKLHGTAARFFPAMNCRTSSDVLEGTLMMQQPAISPLFRPFSSNSLSQAFQNFRVEGLVHIEFITRGCTVNSVFYVEVLKRLRKAVTRKRPEKWRNGWLLHDDNVPSHTSLLVRQVLTGKNLAAIRQPPYSPDLAPCDFWLFLKP